MLALLLVGACQAPPVGHTGFGSMPDVTTAPAASTGGSSSGSGSSGTSTGEDSGSASGSAGSTSGPVGDLGDIPDFGNDSPVGCKGKIDFLFMIARNGNMQYRQAQLAAAFPQFIDTIQAKFADFDYHIMVVDGDGEDNNNDTGWGSLSCNSVCPNLACKVGEPCCKWGNADLQGMPCCGVPNYPCQDLDLVTACDWAWGAGTVFPAGYSAPNKPCPIDGGRRYLVKGQSDLEATFACIATVGASGYGLLGQALTAAMQSNINDPGGCNNGFLRRDALLMVTFISNTYDQSEKPFGSTGTPDTWRSAVMTAKGDDPESVVMFGILDTAYAPGCHPEDRICQFVRTFPFSLITDAQDDKYAQSFTEAAELVDMACASFVPPG